jgi:tetratricopeptide (TPR) repeat protein
VTLPDLSNASAPVQSQIRQQHASLMSAIGNAAMPAENLAAAYGQMGKLLIAAEYFDAAESCLLNAQALAPAAMRWPYYLGHLQRFRNKPADAAAAFEQALRLQPDDVPALIWLGEMHLAQNQADAADPLFRKALSLQQRSGAARYGLGRVALARQDYKTAVQDLEEALALAPKASLLHYPLALAYRGLGDRQKAEAHLKQRGEAGIRMSDPLMEEVGALLQNATAYEVLGAEALGKRQWPEAVTHLRRAIQIAPDNALARLNLGTALYMTGDSPAALEQFEAALRLSPGLPKAHFGIGVLMETSGRDREAIDQFSAAIAADPRYVEARMQLADALRRSGRVAESLPHYEEILSTNPGVSQAMFGHAMGLVRLARYRDARDRFSEGMKTYADQPGFAHAVARILASAPDAGARDGSRALALTEGLWKRQQTIGLAETMAMALAEAGRFEDAVVWQRNAIAGMKGEGPGRAADVARMTGYLRLYERRQPCRTPWPDDDPVHHPRPQR